MHQPTTKNLSSPSFKNHSETQTQLFKENSNKIMQREKGKEQKNWPSVHTVISWMRCSVDSHINLFTIIQLDKFGRVKFHKEVVMSGGEAANISFFFEQSCTQEVIRIQVNKKRLSSM